MTQTELLARILEEMQRLTSALNPKKPRGSPIKSEPLKPYKGTVIEVPSRKDGKLTIRKVSPFQMVNSSFDANKKKALDAKLQKKEI